MIRTIEYNDIMKHNEGSSSFTNLLKLAGMATEVKESVIDLSTNKMDARLCTSITIEKKNERDNIPNNKIYKWIDDNIVSQCQNCNIVFTFIERKHHCRSCGRIFCQKCSSQYMDIPDEFALGEFSGTKDSEKSRNKNSRVCQNCHKKINRYLKVTNDMNVFEILNFDITILYNMRYVCKLWKEYADVRLNRFRELQYVLPNHKFTDLEKKLLWTNYYYTIHHPRYFVSLLKSIDHHAYHDLEHKLKKVVNLIHMKKDKKYVISCKEMLCTRHCKSDSELKIEDAFNLLTEDITNTEIRKYAISSFNDCPDNELTNYISFLVHAMKYETFENPIIGNFLMNKCKNENKIEIYSEFFWELQLQLEFQNKEEAHKIYRYFSDKIMNESPGEIRDKILTSQRLVKTLSGLHKIDEKKVKETLSKISNKQLILPIQPVTEFTSFDIDGLHIKTSASMPLALPMNHKNGKKTFMFKFEDIRRDQIIMSLINLISIILKRDEGIDIPILTYKIRPTGANNGFIEIVPDSNTVYHIKENLKFTLLNYIIEKNDDEKMKEVRQRFMHSCAMYCVITYLFGIGDRHLDNIMLTTDGRLFHIDFSYILGYDPKPLTTPTMRISAEMIDVIGGINSIHYKEFKDLCTKIYNAIRKHISLFINVMLILVNSTTKNVSITKEKIYDEMIKRFLPGENCYQAEIQLDSVIDNCSRFYTNTMIDTMHNLGKQQQYYISNGTGAIWSSFKSFFGGSK